MDQGKLNEDTTTYTSNIVKWVENESACMSEEGSSYKTMLIMHDNVLISPLIRISTGLVISSLRISIIRPIQSTWHLELAESFKARTYTDYTKNILETQPGFPGQVFFTGV